jgi:hypothetical protein
MYLSGPVLSPLLTAKSRGIWSGVLLRAPPLNAGYSLGGWMLDAAIPMTGWEGAQDYRRRSLEPGWL